METTGRILKQLPPAVIVPVVISIGYFARDVFARASPQYQFGCLVVVTFIAALFISLALVRILQRLRSANQFDDERPEARPENPSPNRRRRFHQLLQFWCLALLLFVLLLPGILKLSFIPSCWATECVHDRQWPKSTFYRLTSKCISSASPIWINYEPDFTSLQSNIIGQHIAVSEVTRHIRHHLQNDHPTQALVLSFHGPHNVGKSHLAEQIARALFRRSLASRFVGIIDSPQFKANDKSNQESFQAQINAKLEAFNRPLIVIDHVDRLPDGFLEHLSPFIERHAKRAIFLLISTSGAAEITQITRDHLQKKQLPREALQLNDFPRAILLESFAGHGGLNCSQLKSGRRIHSFVPFLPLSREQVMQCVEASLRQVNCTSPRENPGMAFIEAISDEMEYDESGFSTTGCNGVQWKVYEKREYFGEFCVAVRRSASEADEPIPKSSEAPESTSESTPAPEPSPSTEQTTSKPETTTESPPETTTTPSASKSKSHISKAIAKILNSSTSNWHSASKTRDFPAIHSAIYGQHIAVDIVTRSIAQHLRDSSPKDALVLSFHGPIGTGKSYLAELIAKQFTKKFGSQAVHRLTNVYFVAEYSEENVLKFMQFIENGITASERSLFIIDSADRFAPKILDTLVGYLENSARKCVFILLSNTGSSALFEVLTQTYNHVPRANLQYQFFEGLLEAEAHHTGGLANSELIHRAYIDYFVPFLPLERQHVRQCTSRYLTERRQVFDQQLAESILDAVLRGMTFVPQRQPQWATVGCKRIEGEVERVVQLIRDG